MTLWNGARGLSSNRNVSKTKDMVFDLRKSAPTPKHTVIEGTEVDRVEDYKYLGSVLDYKLCIQAKVAISKKIQQCLYLKKKMNSFHHFNVCTKMTTLFFMTFIESVLSFTVVTWFGSLNLANWNELRLSRVASKVIWVTQVQLSDIYDLHLFREVKGPLQKIATVPTHRTKRFKLSFVSTTFNMWNLHNDCTSTPFLANWTLAHLCLLML